MRSRRRGVKHLTFAAAGLRIDAARFSALFAEHGKAPEVTRRRIYIETLQDVMPDLRSKIIVDEQTGSILPLPPLDAQMGDR